MEIKFQKSLLNDLVPEYNTYDELYKIIDNVVDDLKGKNIVIENVHMTEDDEDVIFTLEKGK